MHTDQASPAVAIARAHIDAWSNHDFDAARHILAADVHVTTTTTQPIMKDVDTVGVEDYMTGLKEFAQTVVPGSARVIASVGDDRNALLLVTVQAVFGPDAAKVTVKAARLYLLDDTDKIQSEQVIFYAAAE
jgi:hypothetical protein